MSCPKFSLAPALNRASVSPTMKRTFCLYFFSMKLIRSMIAVVSVSPSNKLIELVQVFSVGDSELAVKEVESIVHPSYEAQSWPAYDIA